MSRSRVGVFVVMGLGGVLQRHRRGACTYDGLMRHALLQRLLDLELPRGDWALFGSGSLLARGWIDDVGDLDVIVRGAAWEAVQALGRTVHLSEHDVDVVVVDDRITFGTRWGIGSFDTGELIDTAEEVDGIPCVRTEHVVAYEPIAGRPKDTIHLAVIEAWS